MSTQTDTPNKIVKLISAWAGTFQPIEDTLQAIIAQRDVNQAVGAQLDLLGKLVGQSRAGLTDPDYRRYIRARIATNRSDGVVEDLIRVATLVLNATAYIKVAYAGTATIRVQLFTTNIDDSTATIVSTFLQQAKSAGVRLIFEWIDVLPADAFTLDSGPGLDSGHLAGGLG